MTDKKKIDAYEQYMIISRPHPPHFHPHHLVPECRNDNDDASYFMISSSSSSLDGRPF
jgi:hypothetical protein